MGGSTTAAANAIFGPMLNGHRASIGLPPVRTSAITPSPTIRGWRRTRPWARGSSRQTSTSSKPARGSCADDRPLPSRVGWRSWRLAHHGVCGLRQHGAVGASKDTAAVAIEAIRAQGRRTLLARGWADLALIDDRDDCFAVGEVDQQALFRRVAAVVHHGGAGTTTTAARAGAPQMVIPQVADQPYWAGRVADLGIGTAHNGPTATTESLSAALKKDPGTRETPHKQAPWPTRSVPTGRGGGRDTADRRNQPRKAASILVMHASRRVPAGQSLEWLPFPLLSGFLRIGSRGKDSWTTCVCTPSSPTSRITRIHGRSGFCVEPGSKETRNSCVSPTARFCSFHSAWLPIMPPAPKIGYFTKGLPARQTLKLRSCCTGADRFEGDMDRTRRLMPAFAGGIALTFVAATIASTPSLIRLAALRANPRPPGSWD